MNLTQRRTDIACLLVGVVTTVIMMMWHLVALIRGEGLDSSFYINTAFLLFGWIALGSRWRDRKISLLPGISNFSSKSLKIMLVVSTGVWLVSCVLFPGLMCFISAVIMTASLREMGFRQSAENVVAS